METDQRLKAKSAFFSQRSKLDGEEKLFWVTEAEVLARLATNAERQRELEARRIKRAA
jgi:hypothetical protein